MHHHQVQKRKKNLCSRSCREGSKASGEFSNLTLQHLEPFVCILLTHLHDFDLQVEISRAFEFVRVGGSFAVVVIVRTASSSFFGICVILETDSQRSSREFRGRRDWGTKYVHDGIWLLADVPVDSAEMFGEVFLAREAGAAAPFAGGVRTFVA